MLQEQNVTAIHRRFESADLVREALREHGFEVARVHVIPDRKSGIDDMADYALYDRVIQDLDPPDADAETYRAAVRGGDFVVSATVPSSDVPRVEEIMRHPEPFADCVDPLGQVANIREEQAPDNRLDPRSPAGRLETTMPLGH